MGTSAGCRRSFVRYESKKLESFCSDWRRHGVSRFLVSWTTSSIVSLGLWRSRGKRGKRGGGEQDRAATATVPGCIGLNEGFPQRCHLRATLALGWPLGRPGEPESWCPAEDSRREHWTTGRNKSWLRDGSAEGLKTAGMWSIASGSGTHQTGSPHSVTHESV